MGILPNESEKPHMIIGVDFGMTCTGVAFVNLSTRSATVKTIQKWPGRMQANEDKVPTILVYPDGSSAPSSWGFKSEEKAEQHADDRKYMEWFKTCLDEEKLDQRVRDEDPPFKSMEDVEKLFKDYLSGLYQQIKLQLAIHITGASWEEASVEFLFSVPTTWDHQVCQTFAGIARKAGFGQHANHRVLTSLTEAEAAAVFTSTEQPGLFKNRDILLICDAGGGTTDISVLRVFDIQDEVVSLEQLDVVFGDTIGSAAIDQAFEDLAAARLSSLPQNTPALAAWEMMKTKEFQNTKCALGSPADAPMFGVPIPTFEKSYTNEEAGILNGEMQFKLEDLQHLFDVQIDKMEKLIDQQLRRLEGKCGNEQVAYVVLSGGLGNSAYVQTQLKTKYARGIKSLSNTENLQFRIAAEPQLAVCKGLVVDRLKKVQSGRGVINTLCCRSSYGTMCLIEYDRKIPAHREKRTFKDARDGKTYISNAIAWFIKKGEPINVNDPIKKPFSRKVDLDNPARTFRTSIVKSDLDSDELPIQMTPDAHVLCEIDADLSSIDKTEFKEKNNNMFTTRQPYRRVDYHIQVIIESTDIWFELWFKDRKLSRDQSLSVEWYPAAREEKQYNETADPPGVFHQTPPEDPRKNNKRGFSWPRKSSSS